MVAGCAGEKGARLIALKKREELRDRFREDYIAGILREEIHFPGKEFFLKAGAGYVYEAGEGGVLSALYRMGRERKAGMMISLKRIPVRQSTIEITELYGLNPYRLFSECMICLCQSGERLAEALNDAGIPAARIGRMTGGPAKIITDKTETEYLNKPSEDEIRKIIPERTREDTNERKNSGGPGKKRTD